MLGRTDSRLRLIVLLLVLAVGSLALVSRLAFWQVVERDWLVARAVAQTTVRTEVPSSRGAIYDRSGTVVLATSADRERLVVAPRDLTDAKRRQTGDELATILGLDVVAASRLRDTLATDKAYVIVAREIEVSTADRIRAAIRAGRVNAVTLEPEPIRVHPQRGGGPDSTLAAHLLGFVNREGNGQYGVEQRYHDVLAGSPKIVVAQRDITGRAVPETASIVDPGMPGADIRLTIDASLQLALEQELLAAWVADKAKSVSAVVLDPYTGEVYAMATYPSYDADQYRAIASTDPGRFIDPIVSTVYEPGSVFKMMTAAAALESGTVKMKSRLRDIGTLRLDGGRTKIDNADRKGKGMMTFEDGMAWSRNVIAAKVALGLGKTTRDASIALHDMWLRLGFGRPTGIDVAGEVRGIVRDPKVKAWREIDLANGSFGQGVAVTPIQLAQAFAALINGGYLVQPHVVKAIGDRDVALVQGGQVISSPLSATLVQLMSHVVTSVPFYSDRTLIKGYYVGGKTGTAQIWDTSLRGGRGAWKNGLFNYSFVGYVGREADVPDLVVAIRIEEGHPTILNVGQIEMPVMSFELFRRIAHDAITTSGLLADRPAVPASTTTDR
jgi:cell division protein FtsI/penicillin-binding protein 2